MKFAEILDQLFEGWHRHRNNEFTADISEIEHHKKSSGRDPNCPKCGKPVHLSSLRAIKDREGDIQDWEGTHSCGAKLTIFND